MRRFLPFLLLAACGTPATNTLASVEEDGSFTHVFEHKRDDVFHAAIAAAEELGYRVEVADPMAGRVSARSEVKRRGLGAQVQYYILRADMEAPQAGRTGVRMRVTITFTHHLSGESRTSINDQIVGRRERYDAFFEAVARQLGE
jgi:hypothetical protein